MPLSTARAGPLERSQFPLNFLTFSPVLPEIRQRICGAYRRGGMRVASKRGGGNDGDHAVRDPVHWALRQRRRTYRLASVAGFQSGRAAEEPPPQTSWRRITRWSFESATRR